MRKVRKAPARAESAYRCSDSVSVGARGGDERGEGEYAESGGEWATWREREERGGDGEQNGRGEERREKVG